jgi:DNA polymerase III subunit delta
MPIYVYWGEDDFALEKAVSALRDRILDPMWISFNYVTLTPESTDAEIQGLNAAMTPPFGTGGRLVWLVNSTVCQQCSENLLAELQRTLSVVPETSVLLITSRNKPDERLKSTKLLKQFAQFQEFPVIPPWKTELIIQAVSQAAQITGVKLTAKSTELLAEAVGNDTRLLYNELEKIRLYAGDSNKPQDENVIIELVRTTTQNSLQLAAAIRIGDTSKALTLVTHLINASEPGLRIVATLIGQFRTWLWIKIMIDSGEKNQQEIAKMAEIGNPKRIYFLQQEVSSLSVKQLVGTLPLLLDLEVALKQGAAELPILQTKIIELCQLCQRNKN